MKTFKNTVAAYCGITLVLLLGVAVLCGCTGAAEDENNKSVQQEIGVVDKDTDVLDAETEQQIRRDYWYGYLRPILNRTLTLGTIDEVKVEHYLGTYNGYIAVIMTPDIFEMRVGMVNICSLEVAGTLFGYVDNFGTRIFIWKLGDYYNEKGQVSYKPLYNAGAGEHTLHRYNLRDAHESDMLPFYDLRDAYDLGMVTAGDVKSIAERFWKEFGLPQEELKEMYGSRPLDRYPTIFTPEELKERAQAAQ